MMHGSQCRSGLVDRVAPLSARQPGPRRAQHNPRDAPGDKPIVLAIAPNRNHVGIKCLGCQSCCNAGLVLKATHWPVDVIVQHIVAGKPHSA